MADPADYARGFADAKEQAARKLDRWADLAEGNAQRWPGGAPMNACAARADDYRGIARDLRAMQPDPAPAEGEMP